MSVESDRESSFEDEFAGMLRGAAMSAPADGLFGLAAGAERVGRRRRNRRRAVLAAGLVAAMVVAGSVGVLTGEPGQDVFGPAGGPVRPMTEDEVVRLVTGLLPPGSVKKITAEAPGSDHPSRGPNRTLGVLSYDDGAGATTVAYFVERGTQPPEQAVVCVDPSMGPKEYCDRTVRSDGSVLMVDKSRDGASSDTRIWRGVYATPDGTVITIVEYNGEQTNPTREFPALDERQLAAMATAPVWGKVVAEIRPNPNAPKDGGPKREGTAESAPASSPPTPASTSPAPVPTAPVPTAPVPTAPVSPLTPSPYIPTPAPGESLPELAAVLARVLPAGAQEVGRDEAGGAVTVGYEGRTSRVSVRVEPAGQGGILTKKTAEEGTPTPLEVRQTLPDGTFVVMNRFGNGKGAVDPVLHWVARVYYPDGRNVVISEGNGEDDRTYRPGEPALSVEQLKAMVLAPDWRK
ncbi:hypothetical protein ACIQ9P_00820 [Kitasatospora sp. NPDC094019]|uniref:hypothetical protein n=1 Tax=Kitasatospora sp. NPDC094019 TaxID=3364091 RepID=UPI0037F72333